MDHVVQWCLEVLEYSGYGGCRVTLRSDGEPAILAVKSAIARLREGRTALIEAPVRESKSNGATERAIRTWRGLVRTWKHRLEREIGKVIPDRHPVLGWLSAWVTEVHNRCNVYKQGKNGF